jgi:hypothetical protein
LSKEKFLNFNFGDIRDVNFSGSFGIFFILARPRDRVHVEYFTDIEKINKLCSVEYRPRSTETRYSIFLQFVGRF